MKRPLLLLLSLALCSSGVDAHAGLQFDFDYRFDSMGFFDDPVRREALEAAGRVVSRYTDDLEAIIPEGDNTWTSFFSPPDGSRLQALSDLPVAEGTMQIFVAGRSLPGRLAVAMNTSPSGLGDPAWVDTVRYRGQEGAAIRPATDVGPMGGWISFNSTLEEVSWHFELSTDELEPDEFDFVTVAMHEIMHLMGYGTSTAWVDQVDRFDRFVGPQATEVGSPSNPNLQVDSDEKHLARNTKSTWNGNVQETLLAPAIFPGMRAFPTELDRAVLRDLGWTEALAGDANLDGRFDSSDVLTVFKAGRYDTGELAGWSEGDWNDNGLFESSDLVAALQTGTFEAESPAGSVPAPEPSGAVLVFLASLAIAARRSLNRRPTTHFE